MADQTWMLIVIKLSLFVVVVVLRSSSLIAADEETVEGRSGGGRTDAKQPTVFVAMLVRNKAHTLPWFLHYFEKLDYPKNRMRLWIRSDHNEDNSVAIVQEWLSHVKDKYDGIDFVDDPSAERYDDNGAPFSWSEEHMKRVIELRQAALDEARRSWADYFLMVDVDNFLLNSMVLRDLIREDRLVIAPMFNVSVSEHYSNFWCGMDSRGYYMRTPDYVPILKWERRGVFEVPVVHSTVLIQLWNPATKHLSYHPPPGYTSAIDDIIIFAHSAKFYGIPFHIMNQDFYGYMLIPMEEHDTLEDEKEQFMHLKLEYIVLEQPLERLHYIEVPERPLTKLGFDEIYLINLERRPDRRQKMLASFQELGINASIINAVDGKKLNDSYLLSLGISMMQGYADPYHGRAMTMGEVGCFLSHYLIWQDVISKNHRNIIVFEDDVRFRPYFLMKLRHMMREAETTMLNWDLIYLGRKRLRVNEEHYVRGADSLVWPHYSYWTLSYILSYKGALKLIQQQPLGKLIPVDEFLPIMFDKHPETDWKENFFPRNLVALSAYPLLVEPTHYTGEEGYFTDTDDSPVIGEIVSGMRGDLSGNQGSREEL